MSNVAPLTNTPDLKNLGRAGLYAHAVHSYRRGGGTEPEVVIVAQQDQRAVLKDYGRNGGWFGFLIGPLLIRREVQALRQLAGLPGIPELIRQVDSRAMLMQYIRAEPWPRMQPPTTSFDRLHTLITSMHARGVAHGDLRAPSNILVDTHGQPYIVDFAARVMRGRRWNRPWNWIFRRFCAADHSGLAKLKVKCAPELATAVDREMAQHRGFIAHFARAAGQCIRSVTRLFVRQPKS